jgi:hypothetical protein
MAIPVFADRIDPQQFYVDDPNGGYYGGYTPEGYRVQPTATGYELWSPAADNLGDDGRQYGQYWQGYDQAGNRIGDPRFANSERSNGFIGDNLDIIGPLLVGGFAGWGAGLFGGGLGGGAGATAGTTGAVAGTAGAEAASLLEVLQAAAASNPGLAATLTEAGLYGSEAVNAALISRVAANPSLMTQIAEVLQSLPSGVKNLLGSAVSSLFGSGALDALGRFLSNPAVLGSGLSIGAAVGGIDRFRDNVQDAAQEYRDAGTDQQRDITDAGQASADRWRDFGRYYNTQYGNLGDNVARAYGDMGTNFQTRFNDLGSRVNSEFQTLGREGNTRLSDVGTDLNNRWGTLGRDLQGQYNNLGQKYQGQYNTLADKGQSMFSGLAGTLEGKYGGLADKVKESIGEFKPYALTTNIGSTDDKGNFTLNPQMQGINDAAALASQKSFDAVNAFDLPNIREQEYGIMQDIYRPEDEAQRLAVEDRLRKQGRLGLQSFSSANSVTDPTGTYGAAPELVAMYQGQKRRNLESYLTADDNALKRRGGLLTQGVEASNVPLNFGNFGLNLTKTGADLGQTDFNSRLASADRWAPIAGRGIDAYGNAMTSGINSYLTDTRSGIATGANAEGQGISAYGNAATRGLQDYGTGAFEGARFQNTQDTTGLTGMLADERSGVVARNAAEDTGLDRRANLYTTGLGAEATANQRGTTNLDSADAAGITAKYNGVANDIKTRVGGEERALNAVLKLFDSLSRQLGTLNSNSTAPKPTTVPDAIKTVVGEIVNNIPGLTEEQATDAIWQAIESTPDFGGNWDEDELMNQIWNRIFEGGMFDLQGA